LTVLHRFWNLLSALVLRTRGRWRLRRGDADGAATILEAAASRSPGSFRSLLDLTRAHLRRHDLVLARRALARAREASPGRYEREAPAAMRAEGFDLAALAEIAAVRAGGGADGSRPDRGAVAVASASRVRVIPAFGDCKDLDEYTRFRSMPPITPAEIAATDWDAIIDDLQDG
jgi:hypothetical protein